MRLDDFRDNPRIQTFVAMLRDLSLARTPAEALSAWAEGYWRTHPVDLMLSVSTRDLEPGRYRITRNIRVAERLASGERMSWPPPTPRDQLAVHSGGFIGAMIADGRPKLLNQMAVREDPVLGGQLAGMGSAAVIPLYHEGKPIYWNIPMMRDPEALTAATMERSLVVANLVGGNNTRLQLVEEVRRLNSRLTEQLEDVARVQRSLLPKRLPDIPGLALATSYLTSDQAGGDYYDFFPLAGGRWGILIADVAGHGAAAATIMAMLRGILHTYVHQSGRVPDGPDAVMRYANARLVEADLEGSFVTAFFAVFDPDSATLSCARCGHNPPLLKPGDGGPVRPLDGAGSLPLGVLGDAEIHAEELRLSQRDTVVLYTDGITEAMDRPGTLGAGGEMFGMERLEAALNGCSGEPDCVVDSVHAALFKHTGSLTRTDDQTLVALRYTGRPSR
ncbi:MAG: PP2C family protein-serine/threonine phosphatase [Phycisphaerales bacterium]|nr:PP2C family protein-serine/threonine phosphatase [Phycisphaerales bacterium]